MSRLIEFLKGGNGIALGKQATMEGLDCNLDATFEKNVYLDLELDPTEEMLPSDGIVSDILLELNVDAGANKDTDATYGEDRVLFNAIRALGWYDDVIEE